MRTESEYLGIFIFFEVTTSCFRGMSVMKLFAISKSKYLVGCQCSKWLWYQIHRPEDIPAEDQGTKARFSEGSLVGEYAKKLFPEGVEVPWDDGLNSAVERTQELIKAGKTIFEATFAHDSPFGPVMMRADVLVPVADNEWDLIEVKSSTQEKDVHLPDIAFQRYVAEGAGVNIRTCSLMHLSREYVRHGDIDPKALFGMKDLTLEIQPYLEGVEDALHRLFFVLGSDSEPPQVKIGPHCNNPYECPMQHLCWAFLPENHVFNLSRIGKKAWELLDDHILSIGDIEDDYPLTTNQRIQVECGRTGLAHADRQAIKEFLKLPTYPLYYMDFETFQTGIPLFDGLRPYDQVPFQFSVHVQETPGSSLKHHSFLAEMRRGRPDPRPEFLRRLKETIGSEGSIVVYNSAFEKRILTECAEAFPVYAEWIYGDLVPRLVDLLAPFRSFHYYHPAQHGSASLKAVLPALTNETYDGLEIADGQTASLEFLRISTSDPEETESQKVRQALEQYCGLDTEAEAKLIEALIEVANDSP